jgi:hypothetical protein
MEFGSVQQGCNVLYEWAFNEVKSDCHASIFLTSGI